jgi:hypothetical protein
LASEGEPNPKRKGLRKDLGSKKENKFICNPEKKESTRQVYQSNRKKKLKKYYSPFDCGKYDSERKRFPNPPKGKEKERKKRKKRSVM